MESDDLDGSDYTSSPPSLSGSTLSSQMMAGDSLSNEKDRRVYDLSVEEAGVEVEILDFGNNGRWADGHSTWGNILNKEDQPRARLIFASQEAIKPSKEALPGHIAEKFSIPPLLRTRLCYESNGFAGSEPVFDTDGRLQQYTHWCRFNVKQVFQKLKPKRTYTKTFDNTNPVHDSFTRLHGWKWYEMTFFAHWTPSQDTITILCLNLPDIARDGLCEALNTCASKVDLKDPYSITVFLVHQVLRLYDDSVWSIRDHVCEWESNRPREPNYGVLHEVARHAVHVSETLEVASQSIRSIQQQHQDFLDSVSRERDEDSDGDHGAANHRPVAWRKHHSPFRFPLKLVEALTCRAESNKARIQNEMQLAFHTAAQKDSKVQVRIGEQAGKEAEAMKVIAVITMTFLPATFVSTIFSMPFFQVSELPDRSGDTLFVSREVWMYWVFAVPLTLLTFVFWFSWEWHSKRKPKAEPKAEPQAEPQVEPQERGLDLANLWARNKSPV